MRTFGLLIVLLCGLVLVCGASDSARQSASLAAAVNPYSADWFNPSAIGRYDFVKLPPSDQSDWVYRGVNPYRGFNPERDGDTTCYTMHIFGMKRESPHSDVTVPDGQWTCRRASKYSVKKVEELNQTPSR